MKAKHSKTLRALFSKLTKASITYVELEAMLLALGAELTEREGSRVKFTLHGIEWHAHRPRPGKQAKKYQVEQLREILILLDITP